MKYYCINPDCFFSNPDELEIAKCQGCNTPLLIEKRYWLVRPLHEQCSTRQLFRVEDSNPDGDAPVRQKVMKVVRGTDAEGVPLLKEEAKVLIALTLQEHGGIPQVEDGCFVVETKNPRQKLLCLVMEFIEGQNLDQWLSSRRNQPISENLARNWLRQIAAVLERVHRQDIVHRDIKPSNIMLRTGGQLVLIDFGIATIEGRGLTPEFLTSC